MDFYLTTLALALAAALRAGWLELERQARAGRRELSTQTSSSSPCSQSFSASSVRSARSRSGSIW